jgi:Nif-specific regulatory protein
VLIRGESGTGKELVAPTIHARSPRALAPFVPVNCAAVPESLIESELFGHEKGAFTGAVKARRGKFALADGGTLFLDEIGDLSLAAQAKILRSIQEGEVQPLGSDRPQRVDVRILAATHKPLDEEIAAGRFRGDLYYRLNVGEIEVPPLRDRGEDVILLARAFLARAAERLGRRATGFVPEALAVLRSYGWPGNVRQLQNEVERALILSEGPSVDVAELRARLLRVPHLPEAATLAERFTRLDVLERSLVAEALERAQGNASEAARLLGISRIMMRRRIARFGLGKD